MCKFSLSIIFFLLNFLKTTARGVASVLKETASVGGTSGEKSVKFFRRCCLHFFPLFLGGVYKEMCDLA